MERALVLSTLSVVFLAAGAVAQSVGEKTGVNSMLGIAPKTADFITEAALSDMLEIEGAKIAEQKGNAQEKSFAAQMITDYRKRNTEYRVDAGLFAGRLRRGRRRQKNDT